jgi:putative nucleotidyltransferase with HDIG domain
MTAPSAEIEERLRRLTGRITGLPTLPEMLQKLNRMMVNPRTSAKDVAQVIASDAALASKVLRVVNSSFYGFPSRISTVTHAIVILGFNTVKGIVLSSTIFEMFRREGRDGSFDQLEFWKHSLATGAAARSIARHVGYQGLEEIFIAGLLHDVGKILLEQHLPAYFDEVWKRRVAQDSLFVEAETQVLGITHADIGAWLFETWSLSKGIIDTTKYHHNPALAGEHQRLASIVHIADILARALRFGNGGDRRIPAISETAWTSLGLDESHLPALLRATHEEIEKALIFLEFAK